jgi:rubrerythrin
MERNQLDELLCQALETELGGVKVYETALQCAVNDDLKREWTEYLAQTREHVRVLRELFERRGLDPEIETPGRQVVRHIGQSLVMAMTMAFKSGGAPEAAQIVAAECVVNAETKDHMNWELIGQAARALGTDEGAPLKAAYDQVEDQEDEHLYHTKGWARELWIASLGMPAVLPPPEEVKKAQTAIGAAKAEASREAMLGTQANTRQARRREV